MKLDKTSPERSVDDTAPQPEQARRRAPYLTANLFAACFGLAGLASAWTTLMRLVHGPDWPGNALSIVAALVWLITAIAYLGNVAAQHRWKQELSDQTLGPFASLIFIVPVLLSVPLAQQARGAGEVVFGCATALTVLFGAWITGDWIARAGDIRRWHPGYYRMYYAMSVYLAQQGYVILSPDYRGSSGYSRDWATGVSRDLGGGETQDVDAGADYLKTLSYVDPDRIGISTENGPAVRNYVCLLCTSPRG